MTRYHQPTTHKRWGLDSDRTYDWRDDAVCSPETAEWFWPATRTGHYGMSADNRRALALCARCPVIAQCLARELANPSPWVRIAAGQVWGLREGAVA